SILVITGGSTLGGKKRIVVATRSRISCAAPFRWRSRVNLQVMGGPPSLPWGVSSSMPLTLLMDSSSGRTTCEFSSSGVAPGKVTVTLTEAGSALGKRSTPRSRKEKIPSTTRKLTSIAANTGRFTQSSGSDISLCLAPDYRNAFANSSRISRSSHGPGDSGCHSERRGRAFFVGRFFRRAAAKRRISLYVEVKALGNHG